MTTLQGREILLGVGGGISAYKSCELLRRLQDSGFLVRVVPTRSSLNFVGAATWEALSGREVPTDLWNRVHEVPHISLAKSSDAIVIAPATADLIARLASGRADDLLTNVVLASTAPIILVPAMHTEMWLNQATQANVSLLRSRGYLVIEPEVGRMTGEDSGIGRYPEISSILVQIKAHLNHNDDYTGKRVLVSAGGTREKIDPVRYIGNLSSGKQGYAIALQAAKRGAEVTLVSANVSLPDIEGVSIIKVESAAQMLEALEANFDSTDLLVMSAAVADSSPSTVSDRKIDKSELTSIALSPNPDIVATLGDRKRPGQVIIAFAAQGQTDDANQLQKAKEKLVTKNADLLYFNDVINTEIFGSEETEGLILMNSAEDLRFPRATKMTLAAKLLDLALNKLS